MHSQIIDPLADPIFALISTYKTALAALDLCEDWPAEREEEAEGICACACDAAYAVLAVPPVSPSGLLAYVEFAVTLGAEIRADDGLGLTSLRIRPDSQDADVVFHDTLASAVRNLCGPAGEMTLEEIDARIRELAASVLAMNDQIAAHDLAVQMKTASRNVHWQNRVRKARRMRQAEIEDLRAERKRLKPPRTIEARDVILDVVKERLGAGEWDDVVAEARDRIERRAAA